MYSSENIVIPSNGSSYPFKKVILRLAGAIRFKTIVNCSSESVEKTQDVIRTKKTKSSAVGARASRSNNIIRDFKMWYGEAVVRRQIVTS